MGVTMLNQGVYDLVEASALLGTSVDRLQTWANPTRRGLGPVVAPSFERAFSFVDLISLRVAIQISGAGVTNDDLRRGVAQLQQHFRVTQPLAQQQVIDRLATSGTSFLADLGEGLVDIGKGRQGVFDDAVRLYLRKITFDPSGRAQRWLPAPGVLLDPRIQAGAPCIAGTRVPTATVAELADQETIDDVAADFGLSIEQVRDAVEFQQRLRDHEPLAA